QSLRAVVIASIDYNMIEIRHKNSKVKVGPENLIGKRDCNLSDSIFCQRHRVEIKPECQKASGSFITKNLYYDDYVIVENKSLFKTKQEIAKSECLVVKDI